MREKESCGGKPGNSALRSRKDAETLHFCFPYWQGRFLPCDFASHLPVYFPLLQGQRVWVLFPHLEY